MSAPDEDQDKPYDPTPRKLQQARERGEVPKSADLTAAAAVAGFLITAMFMGGQALSDVALTFSRFMSDGHAIDWSGSPAPAIAGIFLAALPGILPWFVFPMAAAAAVLFVQRAWVVAPEKLSPKISRISPVSNAKQKFGRGGLFEFAKSSVKLVIFCTCLAFFFVGRLPDIITTMAMEPSGATLELLRHTVAFVAIVLVVAAGIGLVDYVWQVAEHVRKNRMSRKELMDESKETEGDPHIRQQRRQKGYDIATNRMLSEVPNADVVIVNPEHFAVALKWERASGRAPICIAKGQDEVALRIRRAAAETGVPMRRDPPTARAIYASVDIGREIHSEHYRPVAAAIRFAEAMRVRARERLRR